MKEITFITGNEKKLRQAQLALKGYAISITSQKIELPEIQCIDCREISEFSAKYAADKLGKPVVTTDAAFHIEALNGFPGPFVKFVNEWLTAEDILKLMNGKDNRKVFSPVCVAYCEPGGESVSFLADNYGELAQTPAGEGSSMDQIYIPKGYDSPIGTLPEEARLTVWSSTCWTELAEYLKD